MSEPDYSEMNQEDATLLLSMLEKSKEEATTDRKIELPVELEK
jgi:hypothetical protein